MNSSLYSSVFSKLQSLPDNLVTALAARAKLSLVCGPLKYMRPGATPQTRRAGANDCACKATARSRASLLTV